MSHIKDRISGILKVLNEDIHEREKVFSIALLSALADQNIFLYGPPGTAKSLISRRLAKVFKSENYFEYLMQKFSTPDEVFGPVSIKELKNDNYIRKTDGYLPTAQFAFLDEIWKSSPAILNTLLTVINEKKFKNGKALLDVPLKVLISASNETPPKGQGLEALYDRFLTRLYVPPLEDKKNFETLLQTGGSSDYINLNEELLIKNDEWEEWKSEFKKVKISTETFNIINSIKLELQKDKNKKLDSYISDRRWTNAGSLLKASAYFCGRDTTNIVDCLLFSHCLWSTNENRAGITKIVEDAVRESGFDTGFSLKDIDEEKEDLDKEIKKEIYHKVDVYKTEKLNGNTQYFKVRLRVEERGTHPKNLIFYIESQKLKSRAEFHPVDDNGNKIKWIKCEFQNQGSCIVKYNEKGKHNSNYLDESYYWNELESYKPTLEFHKGDKKEVHTSLIDYFKKQVLDLSEKIQKIVEETELKKGIFLEELDTPFVREEKIAIAIESVDEQIKDLKLRHKDCERLESLVS